MSVSHIIPRRIGADEKNADLWDHARDVQTLFTKVPVVEHRVVEAFYAEPMAMGGLKEEPFSIECVRIQNLLNAQTVVRACMGFVNFVWLPNNGGAQIQNIGGLTVADNGTTKFRFSYRITYRMA